MKIGICGKMASGKTTLAEALCNGLKFNKFSLAEAVKDFANFLFDIPEGYKDRKAYQKVGDGGRKKLYNDIWIDVLKGKVRESDCDFVVVDDIRYLNEIKKLKEDGWVLVKIDIDDSLQIERLKQTYPENWEVHAESRTHPSEAEIDQMEDSDFDLIIKAENNSNPVEHLVSFVVND